MLDLNQVGGVAHDNLHVLVGSGISSRNALVRRHSMPCMAASSSARLNALRAAFRLYWRPAPCGEEFSASRLPFPVTT